MEYQAGRFLKVAEEPDTVRLNLTIFEQSVICEKILVMIN